MTRATALAGVPAIYYPWFDWLRLTLACIVLLSHLEMIAWAQAGGLAVQVFFALSGWLIGGILLSLPKSELPHFFFNRALRIWCPYFLALGLLIAISLLRDPVTPKWLEFIFYKATFVYNLFGTRQLASFKQQMPLVGTGNHFWSINAEEQFYLLSPLLLVLSAARFGRSVITWAAIALLAWVSQSAYASIAFGVLAAVMARSYGSFYAGRLGRIATWALFLASAVDLFVRGDYILCAPVFSVCLVLLLAIPGKRQPLGAFAGGMSYPLYLNAWIGIFAVNAIFKILHLTNPFMHQLAIVMACLALSAFLYWNFDRRILSFRRRLYTPGRGRAAMAIAYGMLALGVCGGLILLDRGGPR